jgi:hypothetical protein
MALTTTREVTQLLQSWSGGDPSASELERDLTRQHDRVERALRRALVSVRGSARSTHEVYAESEIFPQAPAP